MGEQTLEFPIMCKLHGFYREAVNLTFEQYRSVCFGRVEVTTTLFRKSLATERTIVKKLAMIERGINIG